ncbi:unnamed protein product [Urochloa humidicola]
MAGYRMGDPALRPEEDIIHVPTSYELERELRDWEGNALVTWAMNVPPSTTARNLEDAIIDDFRLRQGDVDVTRHRPEAFLIRFQHRRHCEEVSARGKFNFRGADVCVRPWRGLTGALAAPLFYRVRIVLDGVPRHAWLPDIVERIVGRTCALQCINTNLLHPTDTRGIELWAWTANPTKIPKVMWLTFTAGTTEGSSSSVQVSEIPPARWQRGSKHRILVHLWEIHNYSAVTTDHHHPNASIGEPEKRRLLWFWGTPDGEQEPSAAFPTFQHPPPPRVQERRDERHEADRRDRERRDRVDARRARGDDHPDFHDINGKRRDDRNDDHGHNRWPCDNRGQERRHDGRSSRHGAPSRERSRSPRRYGGQNSYGDSRRASSPDELKARWQRDLKLMLQLRVATMGDVASKVSHLKQAAPTPTTRSPVQLFSNVSRLADEPGGEAWFGDRSFEIPRARVHPPIPVGRTFYRIKQSLPCFNSPTIQEVEAALSKMAGEPEQPTADQGLNTDLEQPTNEPRQLGVVEQTISQLMQHEGGQQPNASPNAAACNINVLSATSPAPVCRTTPAPSTAPVCLTTPATTNTCTGLSGVADLFSTPEQGLLLQPPPAPGKRGRRLKKSPVQISGLRHSKRQACSRLKHLPAEERANHVLCKRLGYIKDDLTPAEQAIQEFIATFKGPMPQHIVAGLTAMFRLDDEDICNATMALVKLGGPSVADGLPEVNDGA